MMLGHAARNVEDGGRLGWRILQETIFLELMTSDRNLKLSREGSK